jgi:hypothetical protein
MNRWISFFALLGALSLGSLLSGILRSAIPPGHGTAPIMHPNYFASIAVACESVILLFTAWAIYRRKSWIWRAVFYLFGAFWFHFLKQTYSEAVRQWPSGSRSGPLMFTALSGVIFGAIGAYWIFRWYKTKAYFFPDGFNG